MKIHEKPKVTLVGRQELVQTGLHEFLGDIEFETDSESDPEILMELAGRTCYFSFENPRPGGNLAYLTNLKKGGHGSVLEHSVWNFVIEHVSRSFSHELVRHRAGCAYSQLSQRYVDESVAEYIVPAVIKADHELFQIWKQTITSTHESYCDLSEMLLEKLAKQNETLLGDTQRLSKTELRKKARSAARSVLPNATETKIFFTANGRALRHIIEMRGSRAADDEIRGFSEQILGILQKEAPNLFGDYVFVNGELTTAYRKV